MNDHLKTPPAIGLLDRFIIPLEKVIKEPIFDCRMCGQCILHDTGLTCPMRCPKNLRNGPCGGVRPGGKCEVIPEMDCVWVRAYERSRRLPWAEHFFQINPPLDWQLQGTSSWMNLLSGRDKVRPAGWEGREQDFDEYVGFAEGLIEDDL